MKFNSVGEAIEYLHQVAEWEEMYIKVKCPDCAWSQFKEWEAVGMTPCWSCNSTGYIFEPLIHCPSCKKEICECPSINRGSFAKYVEEGVDE